MELCPSPFAVRQRSIAIGGTSVFAKPGTIPAAIPHNFQSGLRASGVTASVTKGSSPFAALQVASPSKVVSPSIPAPVAGGATHVASIARVLASASSKDNHSSYYYNYIGFIRNAPPPLIVSTGSYAPPASGSYAPPPLIVSTGSYCGPPVLALGSYTPAPLLAPTGSYCRPPVLAVSAATVVPAAIGKLASGSYAPPILASPSPSTPSSRPRVIPSSGSHVPPVLVPSGSYTPPVIAARIPASGSYCGPPLRELPDPETVERQREAYREALDNQFHTGLAQIAAEREAKREFLKQQAEQAKAQFALQVQSQLDSKHLALDSGETAMIHRKNLEEKAAGLTLDYQQKKASEELLQRQYMIQKHFVESERKLASEFIQKQGNSLRSK
eukprot:CAMPEP_0169408982 /NCGR_PEP_ID=MMETSP1017-20121227/58998_1 /TAXON_ID=342587 /ORGANISM="Karlodinium micrum, Strain CCMP2283" /LENGTH=385 /DNA_ID=CAMNT_0009516137 /DNA_START=32 /DNA_END=1186 /DNA_ORIENTATION=-